MKKLKKLLLVTTLIGIMVGVTGCVKPYNEPEFVKIESSQTAFRIPLIGDTNSQNLFESEELLNDAKVATKEIQIAKRWVQTGRMSWTGEWRPSEEILVVERKPVTREWTESSADGTSSVNQGITAESNESTAFMARMNISAQIDESDAVRFVYRYNKKPLSEIMDSEIRAKVESEFVEQCSSLSLDDIIANKTKIMDNVRNEVIPYFEDKGITITVLGLKGEFTYLNADIQDSIDKKFTAQQEFITQQQENETAIAKAEADKQIANIQQETFSQTRELRELEIKEKAIEKWNGEFPQVMSDDNNLILDMVSE